MYLRAKLKFFLRKIDDVKFDILIKENNKNNCETTSYTKFIILNKSVKFDFGVGNLKNFNFWSWSLLFQAKILTQYFFCSFVKMMYYLRKYFIGFLFRVKNLVVEYSWLWSSVQILIQKTRGTGNYQYRV